MKGSRFSAQNCVWAWMMGFLSSLVIQTLFQKWFAISTVWGANPGWQNEIAVWNVGMILVLFPLSRHESSSLKAIPRLCVLSFLFLINHGWAIFQANEIFVGNILGAFFNLLAVSLGGGLIYLNRVKLT